MRKGKGGNFLVRKLFLGYWTNLNKQIWDVLNDFTYSELSIFSLKFSSRISGLVD